MPQGMEHAHGAWGRGHLESLHPDTQTIHSNG